MASCGLAGHGAHPLVLSLWEPTWTTSSSPPDGRISETRPCISKFTSLHLHLDSYFLNGWNGSNVLWPQRSSCCCCCRRLLLVLRFSYNCWTGSNLNGVICGAYSIWGHWFGSTTSILWIMGNFHAARHQWEIYKSVIVVDLHISFTDARWLFGTRMLVFKPHKYLGGYIIATINESKG